MFYNIVHEQVLLFHPDNRIAQSPFNGLHLGAMPHLMLEAPGQDFLSRLLRNLPVLNHPVGNGSDHCTVVLN